MSPTQFYLLKKNVMHKILMEEKMKKNSESGSKSAST